MTITLNNHTQALLDAGGRNLRLERQRYCTATFVASGGVGKHSVTEPTMARAVRRLREDLVVLREEADAAIAALDAAKEPA